MNRFFFAAALCFIFCMTLYAQDYSTAEIYGGYQLIKDDELLEDVTYSGTSALDAYKRLHGFDATIEYNVQRWIGIVGEVGHGRTSPSFSVNMTEFAPYPKLKTEYRRNQTSFLFGPRFSYRGGRFRAFGHALLGGNRVSRSISMVQVYEDNSEVISEIGATYTDFATAFGGGLDISLGKLISIRPVQLDLVTTYRSYDTNQGEYKQHQFRYSGGIVFRFGSANR